ncbi:hypothetical protein TNCV_4784851 [Trichonephila clavipes]|nr:hypothetical protein TNCV_4784851 [Trichonephila clavipes]
MSVLLRRDLPNTGLIKIDSPKEYRSEKHIVSHLNRHCQAKTLRISPHLSMNSSGRHGGQVIKEEWCLNAFGEGKKSFLNLFSRVMGKAADLSKFKRGNVVMAQRLGRSTCETAQLVGCS